MLLSASRSPIAAKLEAARRKEDRRVRVERADRAEERDVHDRRPDHREVAGQGSSAGKGK